MYIRGCIYIYTLLMNGDLVKTKEPTTRVVGSLLKPRSLQKILVDNKMDYNYVYVNQSIMMDNVMAHGLFLL